MDKETKERREHQVECLKRMRQMMLDSENWENMKNLIEAVTAGGMALQTLTDMSEGNRIQPLEWIPIDAFSPKTDRLILLSFANYKEITIGRYHKTEDGGGYFALNDEDTPLSSIGIFVNAWAEMPKPYREGDE